MATLAELLRPGFKGLGAINTELETGAAAGAFAGGALVFGNGLTTSLAELVAREVLAGAFLLVGRAAGPATFSRAGLGVGLAVLTVLAGAFAAVLTTGKGSGFIFTVLLAAGLTTGSART